MANSEPQKYLSLYRTLHERVDAFTPDTDTLKRFEILLEEPDCFSRGHFPSHFTASALVVDPQRECVLLTHHRKLRKWLQLGGHSDGEMDPFLTAEREVQEESGLTRFHPVLEGSLPLCFDLDIHAIPARGEDPLHEHFDFRFLFCADSTLPLQVTEESLDLKWFSLQDAFEHTSEESMHRQFRKFDLLRRASPESFFI